MAHLENSDLSRAEEILNAEVTNVSDWKLRGFYDKYATNETMILTFLQKAGSIFDVAKVAPIYVANIAAKNGQVKLFNYLLDHNMIDISERSGAIDTAIENNQPEIFKILYDSELVTKEEAHHIYNNKLQLMKYPLLDHCPNLQQGFSLSDSLLSSSYSTILNKEHIEKNIITFFKHPILADILNTVAISANNRPLTIELIDKMKQHDSKSDAVGYFRNLDNRIIISENKNATLNKSTFMHELTHKSMSVIFQNYKCHPYKNSEQREKYQAAIKTILFNIGDYFKNIYNLEYNFTTDINPRVMGKNLAETYKLASYGMISKTGEEIINIFKNNPRLDINNKKLFGNDNWNAIDFAILRHDYKLIKDLIKLGAKLESEQFETLTLRAVYHDANNEEAIEILKLAIEIKPKINIQELNFVKDTLLPLAQLQEKIDLADLLEKYIDDNNTWYNYFSSFIPKTKIEYLETAQKEDNKDNMLNAIRKLLSPSIEEYKEFDQDAEFIANFVGIIAQGDIPQEVVELIKPMSDYFESVIHNEFLQYQQKSDTSSFCLPLPEHSTIFADTYY